MIHQVLYKSVCRLAMMAALMLTVTTTALAQITSVHGTVSDDMGPLMAAVVCEIDNNGRIIESAVTDMNGNFTMRVRDAKKNKIQFQYVGLKTLVLNNSCNILPKSKWSSRFAKASISGNLL